MKVIANKEKIEKILKRVDKIYPSEKDLIKALTADRKMAIYYGIDPTAPFLHLGHSVNLFLLKKFQQMGHKMILLIGDFTAQIGDPSDKDKTRKALSKKEVLVNCKNYKEQSSKIISFKGKNPASLKFNSDWWESIRSEGFLKLLSNFTVQRMLERDMFQRRQNAGNPIWLHEFVYPLLQGYDSVAMDVDVEIGGSDQLFNMLVGRELMKAYKKKEKLVVTVPLLTENKEGRKMSKSEGNTIALNDSPGEMYGKIMALPDESTVRFLELCTEFTEDKERVKLLREMSERDKKSLLAKEIVTIYYDTETAWKAEREFNRIFKEKKPPSKIKKVSLKEKKLDILNLLVKTGLVPSRSEAKRLVMSKGVRIDGQVQVDWKKEIEVKRGQVLQVGKRRFVKIS